MITKILLFWGIFDLIIYLIMWYDSKEHHFNLAETLSNIKENFTQDE